MLKDGDWEKVGEARISRSGKAFNFKIGSHYFFCAKVIVEDIVAGKSFGAKLSKAVEGKDDEWEEAGDIRLSRSGKAVNLKVDGEFFTVSKYAVEKILAGEWFVADISHLKSEDDAEV